MVVLLCRLEELRAQDEARLALDKARNDLEAYMVSVGEKFDTEAFKKCSTPEERQKIEDKLSKMRNWYEEEASVDTNKEVRAFYSYSYSYIKFTYVRKLFTYYIHTLLRV